MAQEISTIIEQRDLLLKQQALLSLQQSSLQKKIDAAVAQLQQICNHAENQIDSTYHGGGYDYCAETRYRQHCLTCGKTLRTWDKLHHGVFG